MQIEDDTAVVDGGELRLVVDELHELGMRLCVGGDPQRLHRGGCQQALAGVDGDLLQATRYGRLKALERGRQGPRDVVLGGGGVKELAHQVLRDLGLNHGVLDELLARRAPRGGIECDGIEPDREHADHHEYRCCRDQQSDSHTTSTVSRRIRGQVHRVFTRAHLHTPVGRDPREAASRRSRLPPG